MTWLTLYNAVTPTPVDELIAQIHELIEPEGWQVGESRSREEGSHMVLLERADPPVQLALWLVPVKEGLFQPPEFDGGCDSLLAASIRTVCKVGGKEEPDPSGPVVQALALAGRLAGAGRVYDAHAQLAFDRGQAIDLAEQPFDIRHFVTYHYLAPPSGDAAQSWLHLHGMAKFFCPDIEAFGVHPEVSHRALALLMHIAAGLAEGQEVQPGEPLFYGHGTYLLRWSDTVRPELQHFSQTDFDEDHSGSCLVVEDGGHFSSLDKLLRGVYEMEPKTREECEAEQRVWQERLGAIKTAWERGGDERLMVRAALELGPVSAVEHIWVAIDSWDGSEIAARLLNDAFNDPAMLRGSPVTFAATSVSGVSMVRERQVLNELETLRALDPAAAERLDAAAECEPEEVRSEASTSPDGALEARFERDGRTAYLHLRDVGKASLVCEPTWLFNMKPTPPLLDLRCLEAGLLPMMSQVQTSQREVDEAPAAETIGFAWDGDRVTLLIDGEPWALVDASQRRGWSRLITLPSRFGRPWQEKLEEETQRGPVPSGT